MPLLRSNTLQTNPARSSAPLQRTTSAPAKLSHHPYPALTTPSTEHYWDYEYRTFRDTQHRKIRTTTITIDFPFVDISVQSPTFSHRANWLDSHAFSLNQERFWNKRAQNFIPSAAGRAPVSAGSASTCENGASGLSTIEEVVEVVGEDDGRTVATLAKARQRLLVFLNTANIVVKQKVDYWQDKVACKGGSAKKLRGRERDGGNR